MDTNILDHLTRVAAERGHDALWSEALPWIAETCQAAGARILVGLAAPIRHQHGQINEDASRAMDEWEEALLSLNNWVPYGRGSL
ncbi:MAG: hypothetical protein ACK2U9_05400, partial [Anaerolineae bacterium]